MSGRWSKQEARRFTEEMKFLLMAGLFFTVAVFFFSTFFFTDVEHTVDDENWAEDDALVLQYKRPKVHPLTNLEEGDVIYIEYKADGEIDIMVDRLDNCYKYLEEHSSFDPYDLPPEAYLIRAGTSGKLQVNITEDEVGVVFQKTLYSGYDEVSLQYKITYPDHYSRMCLILGLMFALGGAALVVIHFLQRKKQKRFEPMEPEDEEIRFETGEEDTGGSVEKKSEGGKGRKRKGKGKGKGSKGKGKKGTKGKSKKN